MGFHETSERPPRVRSFLRMTVKTGTANYILNFYCTPALFPYAKTYRKIDLSYFV